MSALLERSLAQAASLRTALVATAGVRFGIRTIEGFQRDRCLLRASALTYSTLLAVVPLLAVVLAVLKGAGFDELLRPFLLDRFPVIDQKSIDDLLAYIGRANAQAVGGVGLMLLFVSAWTLFGNVEQSLNDIFGVRSARGYLRRIGEYLSMLMVGSIVVVVSVVLQTLLGNPELLVQVFGDRVGSGLAYGILAALPWFSVWIGFSFLYSWMPNTHLPLRFAVLGGIVGGTLFQAVQLLYLELQFGFARYNAIYGALAQLPVLLIWVYLSWVLVLLGAELIVSVRAAAGTDPDGSDPGASWPLGMAILQLVIEAFRDGRATPRPDQLAIRLGVDAGQVHAAIDPLLKSGILVDPEGEQGLLPAVSPEVISLGQVLSALGQGGTKRPGS
ncbi:MAG: YihY/virulence factor BrkB family protein [Myxococcota bacterium]|nr:YihY/virulence factor BrkB family protein [Myxococcota bacterium]